MAKEREQRTPSSQKESEFLDLFEKHKPTEDRLDEIFPAIQQEYNEMMTSEKAFEAYRNEYEEGRNPLFIWEAFQACLIAEKVFEDKQKPAYLLKAREWVMEYFATVAKNLLTGDDHKKISRYLEFREKLGGKTQFTQFKDYQKRKRAALIVNTKLRKRPNLKVEDACDEYAKEHPELNVNGETIKGWYYSLTH